MRAVCLHLRRSYETLQRITRAMITFLYTVCKTILHYFLTFLRGRFLWYQMGSKWAAAALQWSACALPGAAVVVQWRCSGLPAPYPVLQSRTFSSRLEKRWNFNLPYFYIVKTDQKTGAYRLNIPVFHRSRGIFLPVFTNAFFPNSETLGAQGLTIWHGYYFHLFVIIRSS